MFKNWYVCLNTYINNSSKFDPISSTRFDSIALTDIFTLYGNHYAKLSLFKKLNLIKIILKMSKSIIKQQILSSKTFLVVNFKSAKNQNGHHFLINYAKMSKSWYVCLNTYITHSSKVDPIPSSRLDSIALTDIFTLYGNN